MRFHTEFVIALVGWNFLPPADAPAMTPIVSARLTFECTASGRLWQRRRVDISHETVRYW